MDVVDNHGPGMVLLGEDTVDNHVVDSDFHHNRDEQADYQNADGLDIQNGGGTGNTVTGSRAWENSDDGFDLWNFTSPVTLEGNWAFRNGVPLAGEDEELFPTGGHGFFLGGGEESSPTAEHQVVGNLAWGNGTYGFDSGGNSGPLHLWHNTSFDNATAGFNIYADDDEVTDGSDLRNDLAIGDATSTYVDPATDPANVNSWSASGVTVDEDDVASTDDAAADDARGSGGALPDLDGFLHLVSGSDVVDIGVPISGRSYEGTGPDLGAFELGA
jgi:hypothetical protein